MGHKIEFDIKPTPRVMRIIALAERQSASRGHSHLGVEHLLCAIIEDDDSVAAEAIRRLVPPASVQAELDSIMDSEGYKTPSNQARRLDGTVIPGTI